MHFALVFMHSNFGNHDVRLTRVTAARSAELAVLYHVLDDSIRLYVYFYAC
jgi:hypothetical protein